MTDFASLKTLACACVFADFSRAFASLLMSVGNDPTFLSTQRQHPILRLDNVSFELFDAVNALAIEHPSTTKCYHTNGGVSTKLLGGKFREALKDFSKPWSLKPDYKAILFELALLKGVTLSQVQLVDCCIRMKRLRGFRWLAYGDPTKEPAEFLCFVIDPALSAQIKSISRKVPFVFRAVQPQ